MNEFESNKKSLHVGEIINESIEIYKKTAVIGGMAFMTLILIIFLFVSMGLGFFADAEKLPELMKDFDPNKLPLNGILIYIGCITLLGALTSPFIAGMLKMAQDADNNEDVVFSSLFHYVNNPQFIQIVLTTIVVTLISMGLNMGINFILPNAYGNSLGFIISYSISVLTFLAIPFVIFNNLSALEAIEKSISIVSKNFISVLALMIISGLLAIVGLIAFCVGIFFTIPFIYAVQYCIYKRLN